MRPTYKINCIKADGKLLKQSYENEIHPAKAQRLEKRKPRHKSAMFKICVIEAYAVEAIEEKICK